MLLAKGLRLVRLCTLLTPVFRGRQSLSSRPAKATWQEVSKKQKQTNKNILCLGVSKTVQQIKAHAAKP